MIMITTKIQYSIVVGNVQFVVADRSVQYSSRPLA
jgi:hypothetical protein